MHSILFIQITSLQIHADEKNHFCEHCPLSFRHKSSLVRHMFLHTGERPYRCQSCQSSFTARDRLKGHILKHHPNHPAAQELASLQNKSQNVQTSPEKHTTEAKTSSLFTKSQQTHNRSKSETAPTIKIFTTSEPNYVIHLPLQLTQEGGILCLQSTNSDLNVESAGSLNDVSTVTASVPQIEATSSSVPSATILSSSENPLDIAIKEIVTTIEVPVVEKPVAAVEAIPQVRCEEVLFKNFRENDFTEKLFACGKCGREFKYKSFLEVHQKRKCW